MWLYIKTDKDSVFTRSHAEFLLSFLIDPSFKRLSKLVRVPGTLENLNLAVNLIWVCFFLYGNKNVPSAEILRGMALSENQNFYFIWPKIYIVDLFCENWFFLEQYHNEGKAWDARCDKKFIPSKLILY